MNPFCQDGFVEALDRKIRSERRLPLVLDKQAARRRCLFCSAKWQPRDCRKTACPAWKNRPLENEGASWKP